MIPKPHLAVEPRAAAARILIVDDSVVARAVIGKMIEENPRFAVAGAVSDAHSALSFLRAQRVDIIILDVEMPGIDGLTALPDLLAAGQGARVIVVSSSCAEGAAATIQALTLGAADTLVKPGIGHLVGRFAETLEEKLQRLIDADDRCLAALPAYAPPQQQRADFDLVAIGASTGGIHALSQLLRALPANFQQPVLITQHLPASFMPYFAAQIAVLAGRPCDVASEAMRVQQGRIIVAPGESHLRLARLGDQLVVRLSAEKVPTGCMPSVDPMFQTVAECLGPRALGVVLSGMGRDGAIGAGAMVAAGAAVVVQDRASSVVWGMPGAVARAGCAAAVMPPDEIGRLIAQQRRPA